MAAVAKCHNMPRRTNGKAVTTTTHSTHVVATLSSPTHHTRGGHAQQQPIETTNCSTLRFGICCSAVALTACHLLNQSVRAKLNTPKKGCLGSEAQVLDHGTRSSICQATVSRMSGSTEKSSLPHLNTPPPLALQLAVERRAKANTDTRTSMGPGWVRPQVANATKS